jgi:hypothetical protein
MPPIHLHSPSALLKRCPLLPRAISHLTAIILLATAPLSAQAADQKNAPPQGQTLSDSGFRPKPEGFGFENWSGDQYPMADLTADDARAIFGDRVCARFSGNSCAPTPAAKLWLQEMNQMMKAGRCEGMAALSAAFYRTT